MKPSQVSSVLPQLIASGNTPFIWGDPGIGKSDTVRAVAKAMDIGLIDMRLSLYDPTDLRGFPVVKAGAMHFIPPALLPTKGKGILLLDEMPAAPPATQNIAYQLVLDRRLGEYELPKGWHIVAAGNHARNGGVHYSLAPALANRFVHLEMAADPADWDLWAQDNGISDVTRAFIRWKPSLLHSMEERKTGMAFPTPRSWASADSIACASYGALEEYELLKGTVGEGPAIEFTTFVKIARELPTAAEIFIAPDTAPIPASPGGKHAALLMLAKATGDKSFAACMKYIARMEVEFQTAFANDIARNRRELTNSKEFIDWVSKNKSWLV